MAFHRQQNPPSPRLPAQRKCDKTFVFPFCPMRSLLFPPFLFLSSLSFIPTTTQASRHHAATIHPLYHLILSTILLRSFPFRNRLLCILYKTSTRLGSLNQSLLTVPLPPSFFVCSLFTDPDHPSVCTTCCMYTRSPARHGGYLFQIPCLNLLSRSSSASSSPRFRFHRLQVQT